VTVYSVPGSDGRRAHANLQPHAPLSGTGSLPADGSPVAYEVPYDGALILATADSGVRVRVANDPADLASADSMLLPTFARWTEIPVRAGQTVSFFSSTPGSVSAWMAARLADVHDL